MEAWHDLADRCIHLETLKTYDFVCSTAALLPLAQRHFQFAYLKVLKLNNSGIDSTTLPILVEVFPVLGVSRASA